MSKIIQWFIDNTVASNLLMIIILLGGLVGAGEVQKEVFPSTSTQVIRVSMSYPGAAPSEVETQICIRIEEAIADLNGIDEISSEANQGFGSTNIQVIEGYDVAKLLNEIKSRIDAIITFPADVERPIVTQIERRPPLMFIALYGEVGEPALKVVAEAVRDDLALVEGVSEVTINGVRDEELAIEVSEETLRRYNLSFDEVASAIKKSSLNIPAGVIRTDIGDVQIQTRNQAFSQQDFEAIIVQSRPDGSVLTVKDVAAVKDDFIETNLEVTFNDKLGVVYTLVANDTADIVEVTEKIHTYIEKQNKLLPQGLELKVTFELVSLFNDRLGLLLKNAVSGLILVFILLMLFLRPLLAVWVCVGIAIAFCGAIFLLPYYGVSINMLSMFAFLLVLGIVVDDAIIVSESIYTQQQAGMLGKEAAAVGAKNISQPVIIAVVSTIIFFLPMLFVPEMFRPSTKPIVAVIVLCLIFSLAECLLILPSHLASMKPEKKSRFKALILLSKVRDKFAAGMKIFATNIYEPILLKSLLHKGATVVVFVVMFSLSIGVIKGGWIPLNFMPVVPADDIHANITLPVGSPVSEVQTILDRVAEAARIIGEDKELLALNKNKPFVTQLESQMNGNHILYILTLARGANRTISPDPVARRWREMVGEIPEALEYRLDYSINGMSSDIALNLSVSSNDFAEQQAATDAVTDALATYTEVYNVRDSLQGERTEIEIVLKHNAEALGVSLQDVARQIRQGFYGEEIQRIPRGDEDVRVMLRYPLAERQTLDQLDNVRIRTTQGIEIPLAEVAMVLVVPGYTSIKRVDRRRSLQVTADVTEGVDAGKIITEIKALHLLTWQKEFAGFDLVADGNMQNQQDFISALMRNFVFAIIAMYCLMAVAFKSYSQPMLILTAVPFGFMGAVIGHLVIGIELSMMSMLGFFACAGVVVNDNLVLMDRINQLIEKGVEIGEAVVSAGMDRFRPIILTSLTTFIGLVPIMFEQSIQAKFLIPMVVALAFGVLFATTVTLILVPNLYYLVYKLKQWVKRVIKGSPEPTITPIESAL